MKKSYVALAATTLLVSGCGTAAPQPQRADRADWGEPYGVIAHMDDRHGGPHITIVNTAGQAVEFLARPDDYTRCSVDERYPECAGRTPGP
ncbi:MULTISPECIES: hypothetical protein [unclassified Streptomyces]|uniref:hypothetical protein n=1 Tax=unclassified Streptomyces TaxID=2593676 RepID=UPI0028C4D134|nr:MULTISPECIES: hypothetical protein [unclassified Streptomyces]WNO76736.1 hypothetical protein RPQ07_36170 [Streptomyces sp. AM8-1-1]